MAMNSATASQIHAASRLIAGHATRLKARREATRLTRGVVAVIGRGG
jgi:hypothetical protein